MSDNDLKKVFSQNLNNYLTISKKSQIEVANEIGISKSTLISWEKGRTSPDVLQTKKLCKIYGMSMDDIFFAKQIHFK